MRWILGLCVLAVVLGTGAERAAAQCPAPGIEWFSPPPQNRFAGDVSHFRAGGRARLGIRARDASAVVIDWGDGERERVPVAGGSAAGYHVYDRPGPKRVVATPTSACGAGPAGALTVPVYPRCERSRGRDLAQVDCLFARNALRISARGLSTEGTPLNVGCYDNVTNSPPVLPEPEPVASAASCVASPDPPLVAGLLPVRGGRRVTVTLRAPALGVRVALASRSGSRGRLRAARPVGASGRRWRIRLPRALGSRNRLEIRARRAAGRDYWLAGIRPAR